MLTLQIFIYSSRVQMYYGLIIILPNSKSTQAIQELQICNALPFQTSFYHYLACEAREWFVWRWEFFCVYGKFYTAVKI